MRKRNCSGARVRAWPAVLALLAPPAGAAMPGSPPAPQAEAPSLCAGAAAERAGLKAERAEINRTLGDIALGRHRKKRKPSGGEVAAGMAGAAASVLLPFGVGALLGAGAGAAAKASRRKRPAPPAPDVPAMVERMRIIDAWLGELEGCGPE